MVPIKGVIPNEWVSMVVLEKSGNADAHYKFSLHAIKFYLKFMLL
jgi:hypothetical protein